MQTVIPTLFLSWFNMSVKKCFFFLHAVVEEFDWQAQTLDLNPVQHLCDEPEGSSRSLTLIKCFISCSQNPNSVRERLLKKPSNVLLGWDDR